jgi:hypothetical protein
VVMIKIVPSVPSILYVGISIHSKVDFINVKYAWKNPDDIVKLNKRLHPTIHPRCPFLSKRLPPSKQNADRGPAHTGMQSYPSSNSCACSNEKFQC